MKEIKLGIIGLGARGRHVAMYIRNAAKSLALASVRVTAVCDPKPKDELVKYAAADGYDLDVSGAEFYDSADELLEKADIDACIVATRCNLHTDLAVKVLERNIPLFLEKPVSTTIDDLLRLKAAGDAHDPGVVVSFPLRYTPHVKVAKKIIERGDIGDVAFANGWTRVAYGGVYYHDWYRDEGITGGLFLQKSTHDFDYINYLVGKKPAEICAVKSKMVMKGDRPAGLRCDACPDNPTCPEGIVQMRRVYGYAPDNSMCCYAVDTGNEDSGSAILRYEDGSHLSYSQAFFLRNLRSCGRGALICGSEGSVSFDFNSDTIVFARTYEPVVEEIKVSGTGAHFGGDERLTENFVKMVLGLEKSIAPLEEGLMSALICLKARQSAETRLFKKIAFEK